MPDTSWPDTVTEPPLIDEPSIGVSEMPALDQPDERACELKDSRTGIHCGAPASWIAYIVHDCEHPPVVRLLCDRCRGLTRQYPRGECGVCDQLTARVRTLEPL